MPPRRRQQQQPRHQQRRSNQQQPAAAGIDAFALAFLADNVPGPEPPPQPLQDRPTPLPLPENQAPNAHPSPPQQVASPCQQQPNQQVMREPRRELTLHDRYHPSLREFMRWHDGVDYPRDCHFTREQLLQITGDDFYRWCKSRIYGDPDVNETVVPPIHYRLHSVLAWKRAVSHFMPTNNIQWNDAIQQGNPTRSSAMSRLVKAMRRFQTQRRGVSSQVCRPLAPQEYEAIIEACWNRQQGTCSLWCCFLLDAAEHDREDR